MSLGDLTLVHPVFHISPGGLHGLSEVVSQIRILEYKVTAWLNRANNVDSSTSTAPFVGIATCKITPP